MDINSFLHNIEALKGLEGSDLDLLAIEATLETFNEGDEIIRQGVKGEFLWFVVEGSVDVIQTRSEGEIVSLAVLGPNEVFGEISLISGEHTTADIVAKDNVKVLKIHISTISRVLDKNPSVMGKITSTFVNRLADTSQK
jgi:CRP-like cAMP-binding protein